METELMSQQNITSRYACLPSSALAPWVHGLAWPYWSDAPPTHVWVKRLDTRLRQHYVHGAIAVEQPAIYSNSTLPLYQSNG